MKMFRKKSLLNFSRNEGGQKKSKENPPDPLRVYKSVYND